MRDYQSDLRDWHGRARERVAERRESQREGRGAGDGSAAVGGGLQLQLFFKKLMGGACCS